MVSTLQRLDAAPDARLKMPAFWVWFSLLGFVQSLYIGDFLLSGVFLFTAVSQAWLFEQLLTDAYQEAVA